MNQPFASMSTGSMASVDSKQAKAAVVDIRPASSVEPHEAASSEWRRSLKEHSTAEPSILRSPTLSGNVIDGDEAAVGMGVNVSSLMNGNLVEEAARIKCSHYPT